jgi:hypothetical protein
MILLALSLVACIGNRRPSGDDDDDDAANDDDAADDDDATDDDDVTDDDDDVTDDDDVLMDDDDAVDDWTATEYMYAHTATQLYSVEPTHPYTVTPIATFHAVEGGEVPNMTDLAVDLSGQMYAVSVNGLWHVAPQTGEVELVFETKGEFFVAATFLSNGVMLVGGNEYLFLASIFDAEYDVATSFAGWDWDGDMVGLPDGLLYCAMREGNDQTSTLVVYDFLGGEEVWSGTTGAGSLYGVAYGKGILFGFTDEGEILTISQTTGEAQVVADPGIAFWGAATNPVRWAEL